MSQETTEKNNISVVDFDEAVSLAKRLKNGEKLSKKEMNRLARAGKILAECVEKWKSEGIFDAYINNYIESFNQKNGTSFDSLEEIEKYNREKDPESQDEELEKVVREITINNVVRPKELVHCTDAITREIFQNLATIPKGTKDYSGHAVKLGKGKKGKAINAIVAVNYNHVFATMGYDKDFPVLNASGKIIHRAVVSCWCAGNTVITYKMIARALTGKIDDDDYDIPEDIFKMIQDGLDQLRGLLVIMNDSPKFQRKRPILDFDQLDGENIRVIMNGKEIDVDKVGVIEVLKEPILLEWAKVNGNEIDTRDITLQDVPGLYNNRESILLKNCLYERIIAMNSEYKRTGKVKQRQININSIFDYIAQGDKDLKEKLKDPNKKYDILDKAEKILAYWGEKPPRGRTSKKKAKTSSKKKKRTPKEILFYDCEFIKKPGSKREYHAIKINFIKSEKIETKKDSE